MHAYQKGPMIGEGTYGSVICATHKATGRQVAIKKVRLGNSSGKEGVNMSVLRELKALRSLAAPCVVDLLDTFSTKSSLVLVFEFMEWSLEDVIRDKNKALSEADVKSFMQMVLQALAHVHSQQAIHRDIKPDNLLISSDGHLKLADFGLARFLSCQTDSPGDAPGKLTPQVFGRWYRPPELLMGSTSYSYGVDMWAAGCVFAELLLRRPWFPGNCDMDQLDRIFKMLGVPTPEVWPGYADLPHRIDFKPAVGQPLHQVFLQASPEALDLLKRLMAFDPDRRISTSDALAHPYFSAQPQPTPPAQLPKPAATRLNRLGMSRVPAVIPDMLMPHRLLQQQQQGFAVAGVAAAGWADAGEAGEALLMQQQRQQDAAQAAANGRSGLGCHAGAGAARAGQLGGGTSRLLAFSDAPSFSGRFLGHGLLPADQQQQQPLQQQADGQPAGRHTHQGGQRHSVHFAADVADAECEQEGSWKGRLSFSGILDEPTPPAGNSSGNPAGREGDAVAPSAEAAGDENALPTGLPAAAHLHQQQLQHQVNRRASPSSGQAQKGAAGGHQQQPSSSSLRPPLHPNATPVHSRAGQHAQGAAIGSGDDRVSQQQGGSRQRRGVSDLSAALSNAGPGSTAGLGGAFGLLNPLAPLLGVQRGVSQQQVQPGLLDSLAQQAAAGFAGTLPAHASTPAGVGAAEGDTACPMSMNTSARKRTRTVFEAAPAEMGGYGAEQQQQGQDGGDVSMAGSHERRVVRSRRSSIHSGCCSMETDTMDGAAGAAQDAQQQRQEGHGLGTEDRSMSITSNALHAAMAGAQQQQQQQLPQPLHDQHLQQQQRDLQQAAEMPPPHAVQPRAAAAAAAAAGHGGSSRATVAAAAAAGDAADPATSSKGVPGSGGSTCPMSLDHRNTTGQHHQHLHAVGPGSSGQQQRQPPSSGGAEGVGVLNSGDLVTGGRPADELRSMDPAELAELAKFWRPRLDSAERRYLRCRGMQLGEALLQASQPDDDELGPEYHHFPGMDSSPSGCRGLFDTPAKGHTPCVQGGQTHRQHQHHQEPAQQQHGRDNSGASLAPDSFLSPPGVSEQQALPAGGGNGGAAVAGQVAGVPSGLLPAQQQLHGLGRSDPATGNAPAPLHS